MYSYHTSTDSYIVMCKVLMSRDLEIEVNHQIYSVFNLIFNQDIQAGFFPNLIWYQEFLRLGLGKPWLVAVSTWREKRNFLTLCMHYLSHSLMLFAFLIFHIVLILVPVLLHILCNNGIFLHSGLNPAWHFWLSTRFSSNVGSVCIVMVWRDSEAISVSLSKQVADKFGDWWYGKKQLHTCRELSTYWCPLWFDEKNRDWNSLCNNKKVTKLIRFFLWIVHDTKEKYWYKTTHAARNSFIQVSYSLFLRRFSYRKKTQCGCLFLFYMHYAPFLII